MTRFIKALIFLNIFLWLFVLPRDVLAQVVINEILPDPVGTDTENEWLELYNLSSLPQSIDGYILEDKNGKRISLSGIVDKWQVIYPKGVGGFALTNTGSTIKLYESTASAQPPNEFTYVGSTEGKSWGRIPDGGEIYSEKLDPTLGGPNQVPSTPTPTPTLTPTPTPTPTKNPTPTPSKTPTPKPTTKSTPLVLSGETESPPPANSEVLGLRGGLATMDPEAQVEGSQTKKNFPILSWILILFGVSLISFTAFRLFLNMKEGYNNSGSQTGQNGTLV